MSIEMSSAGVGAVNSQTLILLLKGFTKKIDKLANSLQECRTIDPEQLCVQLQQQASNLNQSLAKFQQNYHDPDTARKLVMIRKQLDLQRERLKKLDQLTNRKQSLNKSRQSFNNSRQAWAAYDENNIDSQQEQFDQIDAQIQQQKHSSIRLVQERMNLVKNISNQTRDYLLQQGQQIDILETNTTVTQQNLQESNQNLAEASHLQNKSTRSCWWLLALLLAVVALVIVIIYH